MAGISSRDKWWELPIPSPTLSVQFIPTELFHGMVTASPLVWECQDTHPLMTITSLFWPSGAAQAALKTWP